MNRKSAKNRFQKSNKKERRPKKVLKKVPKKKDGHKKCTKKFTYKVIRFANLRGAAQKVPLTNLGFCPNQGGGSDRIPTFL